MMMSSPKDVSSAAHSCAIIQPIISLHALRLGMSMKENSRQHSHRAVRYCSNQINRETFIQGSPAFFSDQLLGRIDDPPLRMLFDHPI